MIRLKSHDEIQGIRRSCKLLAETFLYISETISEGMTGLELDRIVAERIKKQGAKGAFLGYEGFPNTLCISVNEGVIHGIPNKQPFKSGDVVGVDCGIILDSWVSDMAYTYGIGTLRPEIQTLMKTAEESLYLGIENAREGGRIHDISQAIFKHNKAQGYGVVRPYCGHGVGFDVHEEPQVPNYVGGPNPRIKSGLVIAIEPMINLGLDAVRVLPDKWTVVTRDGKPSVHYEHTIVIYDGITEILTSL
jgi:methionyl aminopeptidase